MNFPETRYEMSRDPKPFAAPETYPEPPKNMWYEVPKEPPPAPSQKPRAIFPWETHQPRPTRVFGQPPPQPQGRGERAPSISTSGEPEPMVRIEAGLPAEPFATGSSTTEAEAALEPMTPTTPPMTVAASFDPWASTAVNAWDDVPSIHRYVERFVDHAGIGVRARGGDGGDRGIPAGALKKQGGFGHSFFKVTDFPSAEDRPSLPVTPAPGARFSAPTDGAGDLPEAEGVPAQRDWVCVHGRQWGPGDCPCDLTNLLRYYKNPVEQLEKLARQQEEALRRRLSEDEEHRKELSQRKLPYGSEDTLLPATTVTSSATVLSPRPVKAGVGSRVRSFGESDGVYSGESSTQPKESQHAAPWAQSRRGGSGHARSASGSKSSPYPKYSWADLPPRVRYGSPRGTPMPKSHGFPGTRVPEPSYHGPSAAWEKGEGDVPSRVVGPLPTDDDVELLDT